MPKKTNLNLGFLLLYDWLPAIYELPAKEVKALLIALIERQRDGKPLPIFKNRMTNSFAMMIEPVIKRRLDGQASGKKGHEGGEAPTPPPAPQREDEASTEKEKLMLFERRKEELRKALSPKGSAPKENTFDVVPVSAPVTDESISPLYGTRESACYDAPPADNALSYDARSALLQAGVPSTYINERLSRAAEWAIKTKKNTYTVLLEWWEQDKAAEQHRRFGNTAPDSESSFDADEVFATMLAKTYGTEGNTPTSS